MIREPLAGDQGYIAATWARSVLSGMRAGHAMRRHGDRSTARQQLPSERDVREQLGARIDAVLDRPDTRGLVVCPNDREDYIVGWILYVDRPGGVAIVHYVYTRAHDDEGHALRGQGIARLLLDRIGVVRDRAVVCTSDGPSSASMRDHFRASVHVPLAEFLGPGAP